MPTIASLSARVRALKRRLARPRACLLIARMAEEHCHEWDIARGNRQPPPDPHPFILRVAHAGFRLSTFMAAHKYLTRCADKDEFPEPRKIFRALLPRPWAIYPRNLGP